MVHFKPFHVPFPSLPLIHTRDETLVLYVPNLEKSFASCERCEAKPLCLRWFSHFWMFPGYL